MFEGRPVLADLDGTLIDLHTTDEEVWTIWADRHKIDPKPFILDTGRGVRAKITEYAPDLSAVTEAEAVAALQLTRVAAATAQPGAVALLRRPAVCIVTSTARRVAIGRLGAAGLPITLPIIAAGDVQHGKPDAEPYRAGAQRLGRAPSDCIAVEDSGAGVASAVAAGVGVVVGLPSTSTSADALLEAGAHVILSSLDLMDAA